VQSLQLQDSYKTVTRQLRQEDTASKMHSMEYLNHAINTQLPKSLKLSFTTKLCVNTNQKSVPGFSLFEK